jgi:lipoprotein-releasing system permease protein
VGVAIDIALAHLKGRKRQTAVSVAGVAMGVGFFVAVGSLMEGSQQDLISTLIDAAPHITVKDEFRDPPRQPVERLYPGAAIRIDGLKPKDEIRGIRRARARVALLDAREGLDAAPTLRGQVVMRYGAKDVSATLIGIEPERERRVSQIENDLTAGNLESLHTAANGVILGSGLVRKLGVRVGETLAATAPTGIRLLMKVVGTFHTGAVAVDSFQAYALLKKVQVLQDRPNVINEIRVKTDDIYAARSIARSIEAQFGYKTESWEEANEDLLEVLVIRNAILYSVVTAILIVAGFGIFNIISTVTFEKARDIAILKSLGFQEHDVRGIFLGQGFVVGLCGAIIGWGLGFILIGVLGSIEFEIEAFTQRSGLPLYEGPFYYAVAGVLAIVSAMLAAYIPARRASRLNPVDIIRGAA